ncbi:MAG: urea ABC transporter ATP-binding protein UrtD [Candidatus Phaeomarinobacter sp.]
MNTSATPHLLNLDSISVSFDGFKALNELSLAIAEGEMRAIIGPNGAGKTTMMDVITGKTRPDTGTAYFKDRQDLTRLRESQIANLGVGRKFQKPTVFDCHTVFNNLLLALKDRRDVISRLFAKPTLEKQQRISDILETIHLKDFGQVMASELSHGQKQWLEIGMLLAQDPALLLVDEPVAGMTDAETAQTAQLLRKINETRTVVVVEHDMTFVRDLDVRVTVLHEGSVLAEGSLDHVSSDERVIEVYLGR